MARAAIREQRETAVSDGNLTVQQVSEMTGLGEHTLRYYEKIGLIAPVDRDLSSKHRRYRSEDVAKLETLACLRAVGMPIEQMRRYFELAANGQDAAAELKEMLAVQKQVLCERIRQMRKNLDYIEYKINFWNAVETGEMEKVKEVTDRFRESGKSNGFRICEID